MIPCGKIIKRCRITFFSFSEQFSKKINLGIYYMHLLRRFLTKHAQTLFPWRWSLKQRNFILHFRFIFTRIITYCRLLSPVRSKINHVQVFLINIQTWFFQERSQNEKKIILYSFRVFPQGITLCPLSRVVRLNPVQVTVPFDRIPTIQS